MPSTVVHVALAGLVGTALLDEHFDAKAILTVMAVTAFIDLDAFLGLWIVGAHRAAFHTLLLPLFGGALLWWDLRGRTRSRVGSLAGARSFVRSRWGPRGVRVTWVSLVAVTFAGIGPDLFFNGVNLLYPVHDRFYDFSGKLLYSTRDGFVQTLVNVDLDALTDALSTDGASKSGAESGSKGGGNSKPASTTENTHYSTAVDPTKGAEKKQVERLVPIAMTGERALLALVGYSVVTLRIWEQRRK